MKRTIIKQGAGYTVTLPVHWIRKYDLDAGHEIDIDTKGDNLVIAHKEEIVNQPVKIKAKPNKKLLMHQIISAYRKGADEVHIHFDFNDIKHRDKKNIKTSRVIQDTVGSLMGFSITEQRPSYVLVQDISKTNNESFDVVLRRTFYLLNIISEECYNAIITKNKQSLEEIPIIYNNVLQLSDYAVRLLHKYEHHDRSKSISMHSVVKDISGIADSFRHIAKHYSENRINLSDDLRILLNDLHELIRKMHEVFYDSNEKKIEEFFNMRDKMYLDYRKVKSNAKHDGVLENIGYIRNMATGLIKERIGE